MTTNPLNEETFTLDQLVSDVGQPLGSTYKSIGINTLKAIGKFIYGTITTILYLLLLIPQVIQLIVFGLFLYIITKLWGSLKGIYEIFAALFNAVIAGPLFAWNIIAMIFNIISNALRIVGLRLPTLPTVRNPMSWKIPKKMPTAIEFVMLFLNPIAKGAKNTVHGFVYA